MNECCPTQGMKARKIAGIAILALAAATLLGFVVMGLWNCLMPHLFGLKTLGFWQALGLLLLARILFGGFHRHGGGMHRRRRMLERWEQMTPEEREKFKEGLRGRHCGC